MEPHPPRSIPGHSLWRDLAIAAVAAATVAGLAAATEFSERLFAWTRGFEHYQLDEWPIALLAFAVSMVALYARRHAQLRQALAENRRLMARQFEVQEEERRRLARELHDELGQTLNAIKLDAVALQAAGGGAAVEDIARRIAGNADQMYGAAGNLIRDLRPPALDELGLVDALEACVDRWRASNPALNVQLSTGGHLGELGETLNLSLYRMVQEGLTNCVRHAGARNLYIDLTRDPAQGGRILLEMRDDGAGFQPSAVPTGHGLTGMRERAALLHGRFAVISQPGKGTTIRAEIPISGRPT
ncbi:MAG TPA: sensor histidine kinase [Steroidobacteraceae bacterium]|nr:sensor histidine kinase [Steroidobacteraceae bacterium]